MISVFISFLTSQYSRAKVPVRQPAPTSRLLPAVQIQFIQKNKLVIFPRKPKGITKTKQNLLDKKEVW
jgi:hypothetical protein